jgi:hypothetical protein
MPRCEVTFVQREGHFSLVHRRAPEIIAALIGESRRT